MSPDSGDDYLIALARASGTDVIVSGDRHLTQLVSPTPPVLTPRQFIGVSSLFGGESVRVPGASPDLIAG